jgi:hypothetical protein
MFIFLLCSLMPWRAKEYDPDSSAADYAGEKKKLDGIIVVR